MLSQAYPASTATQTSPKTREITVTTTHRNTTTITTTAEEIHHSTERYYKAEASTQTSLDSDEDALSANGPPEVTHLEVPASLFEGVVLRDGWPLDGLDEAADAVLNDAGFQSAMGRYLAGMSGDDSVPDDPEHNPENCMVAMMEMIASHIPQSDDRSQHQIDFVKFNQWVDSPDPHDPPEISAVFHSHNRYEWKTCFQGAG